MSESEDVAGSLTDLVAAVLGALRDGDGALSPLVQVCQACASLLPVDGASVSLIYATGNRLSLYATDAVVQRIEDLQFSLGEGPCFEAFETGQPVLVPDLANDARQVWPVFAAEISAEKIGAIFAFPLRRATARFGAMDMYRRDPGLFTEAELATALKIADIATSALLAASAVGSDGVISEAWFTDLTRGNAVVHQATGMIIAEFAEPAHHALARLRGYAFSTGRQLDDVASDLVCRRLHPRVIDG